MSLIFFNHGVSRAEPNVIHVDELQIIVDEIRAQSGLVSLSAGVVNKNGLSAIAVSGVRRRGEEDLVSASDRWHIASCSKAMTSVLVAQFVERGLLQWDATIPQLFPDWGGDMDPAWTDLTLEHLLSHRAGLGDVGALWWIGGRLSLRSISAQRLATARRLLRQPPAKAVGEFSYSNFGYMIVGAALERIDPAHRTWEQMMRDEIFSPLGEAGGFGFGPPVGIDQPEGHSNNLFGSLKPVGQGTFADNPQSFGPAGTVNATFTAWGKFIASMLGNEETSLITEKSRAKITTPVPGFDYALGWYVRNSRDHGIIWSHPGSNRMWRSLHVVAPEKEFGIIVASNQADEASQLALEETVERILALHAAALSRSPDFASAADVQTQGASAPKGPTSLDGRPSSIFITPSRRPSGTLASRGAE